MGKLAIVLPTYNEEDSIKVLIEEINEVMKRNKQRIEYKIYVVDSYSKDKTVELVKNMNINVEIILVKEIGKARAIKEAFKKINEDYLIMLDSDLSYPPEYIPKIYEKLKEFDVVIGSRFKGRIEEGAMKAMNKLGNLIFTFTASLLYKKVSDVCSGMWGFNKKAYKSINIETKRFELEVNLFIESIKKGFEIGEIPITYRKRGGLSKLKIIDGIPIMMYLLKKKLLKN